METSKEEAAYFKRQFHAILLNLEELRKTLAVHELGAFVNRHVGAAEGDVQAAINATTYFIDTKVKEERTI